VIFDPSAEDQSRFHGYGPAEIPTARDREVEEFVATVRPNARGLTMAIDSEEGRAVLCAYAERMASLAVRRRDPQLLERALVAAVVGGLTTFEQGAMVVMPLIEHSSQILALDTSSLFGRAAAVTGHPGSVALMIWLSRPAEDRTLASMGWAEGRDAGGFRYRPVL
jgi:hypothetical protein